MGPFSVSMNLLKLELIVHVCSADTKSTNKRQSFCKPLHSSSPLLFLLSPTSHQAVHVPPLFFFFGFSLSLPPYLSPLLLLLSFTQAFLCWTIALSVPHPDVDLDHHPPGDSACPPLSLVCMLSCLCRCGACLTLLLLLVIFLLLLLLLLLLL